MRYHLPFSLLSPLSPVPIPLPSYSPSSMTGIVLCGEVLALLAKEAIELAPPSWILQLSVCCMEDLRVMEVCDRPVSVEQVCSSNSLQDGVQPVGPQFHSKERLVSNRS